MRLNERIAYLRIQAGLTKAELARRVGTSDVSIAYRERGVISEIGHVKLLRLADEFGMTVSELLDDPMQPRRDAQMKAEALGELVRPSAYWPLPYASTTFLREKEEEYRLQAAGEENKS